MNNVLHCGYIAIIGRPNVGKSTLLNALVGEKVSITSRKPQTTRHRILGIRTLDTTQMIFVDTPGLHKKTVAAMNKVMNRTAMSALSDVDVIIFVVDAAQWTSADEWVFEQLKHTPVPVVLVLNKVDKVKDKKKLLPEIQQLHATLNAEKPLHAVIPLSAKTKSNVDRLLTVLGELLPASPFLFPADQLTDRNERFIAAEIIREKLYGHLGEELPYALTVEIEEYKEEPKLVRIGAVIWVAKDSQKAIVIGAGGELLKKIGRLTRLELQTRYNKKVYLRLWVKVKKGWMDDERSLKKLGYE